MLSFHNDIFRYTRKLHICNFNKSRVKGGSLSICGGGGGGRGKVQILR